MEIWDLLNKGFGLVREFMGGALVRSERVFVETRQVVNGGIVSAWRMWDRVNQALAETAVPDGRRSALIRLQLDDKSEAALPFMAQVPFGASIAYGAKRPERASRIMRKAQARKASVRPSKSNAGRKTIGVSRASVAVVG